MSTLLGSVFGGLQIKLTKDRLATEKTDLITEKCESEGPRVRICGLYTILIEREGRRSLMRKQMTS